QDRRGRARRLRRRAERAARLLHAGQRRAVPPRGQRHAGDAQGHGRPADREPPAALRRQTRQDESRLSRKGQLQASRLRSIQAVFSCTCMRWVSRSALGSSFALSTSGNSERAVFTTASWPATSSRIIPLAAGTPFDSWIDESRVNSAYVPGAG